MALKKAAMESWSGASVDSRTAFLNAPLPGGKGEDDEDLETTVVFRPPPILVPKCGETTETLFFDKWRGK